MTEGMTVSVLFASLQDKTRAAMDCVWQIMLNQKLLHKFEKWCKFSSHVKAKLRKRKLHKMRPACIITCMTSSTHTSLQYTFRTFELQNLHLEMTYRQTNLYVL